VSGARAASRALGRVGVVGVGHMGVPMAGHLLAAGIEVRAFDASEQATHAFLERHPSASVAASLAELAAWADAVLTMLPNGAIVRAVALGEEGGPDSLAGGWAERAATAEQSGGVPLLLDMSSSAPTGTRELGAALTGRGVAMVDAPVSGGVRGAEAGTLAIMAGGDPADLDRCAPLFEAMGSRVVRTGGLGSGHATKALNNYLSACAMIAATEAALVARRFGLDPRLVIEAINNSTGRSSSTEEKFPRFVFTDDLDAGFALDLMLKDVTTAVELAQETETPAPLAAATRELLTEARASLPAGADYMQIVRHFETLAHASILKSTDE
jgi:3-hydroxyisobutyrate dehydrogenase